MCKDTKNAQKYEILIYPKASAYNLPFMLFTDHYKEYQQNLAVLQILRNWVVPKQREAYENKSSLYPQLCHNA